MLEAQCYVNKNIMGETRSVLGMLVKMMRIQARCNTSPLRKPRDESSRTLALRFGLVFRDLREFVPSRPWAGKPKT